MLTRDLFAVANLFVESVTYLDPTESHP